MSQDDSSSVAPDVDEHDAPELSVVICLISAQREAIEACLQALQASIGGRRVECIVPYDARLANVEGLILRFPWVQWIDARAQVQVGDAARYTHEHHHMLRSIGLKRARAPVIGMLEDHGHPAPDWCEAVLRAHRDPAAAIGGAVENAVGRVFNAAAYYCDFGRYQNPLPAGPATQATDINIAYKRAALLSVREHWENAYNELLVNSALGDRGQVLLLDPRLVVYERRPTLRLSEAVLERFIWGRAFAGVRIKRISTKRRWMYAAAFWMLPPLRISRMVGRVVSRRRELGPLLRALPMILAMEAAWALGELVGYVTGKASVWQAPQLEATSNPCADSPS